ncbi:uncharacterized protein MKK02DRAFT_44329 [Dioszegia hungarica]|uniref:Zinc finger FYVE domain-containing protein 19 n=1 Tax=Dioszegia hungarica TaxID=4972 RepID=A0AA38H939_9TREE|nr:uncharacterized protein MKK02DRAFT_44329 [Dioszegia hungarica]KAI9635631.1 hypothetical protein MKK02DRAFT_44329 [Dioszegia hungarica]
MTDEDLLRRFAALKGSNPASVPIAGPSKSDGYAHHIASAEERARKDQEDLERIADGRPLDHGSTWGDIRGSARDAGREERELEGRHEGLNDGKGGGWGMDELGLEDGDGDDDVEAFIASLATAQCQSGTPEPTSTEAHAILRETRHLAEPPVPANAQMNTAGSGDEEEVYDGETEQEILERALEEAELEVDEEQKQKAAQAASGLEPTVGLSNDGAALTKDEVDLFPSIPTHVPAQELDEADQDDPAVDARMAMLLGLPGPSIHPGGPKLPSAPTSKPAQGRQAGQGWNLPGWEDGRDEDLDSWCCICNKDATVQCAGCDDDVYCDECWRDGHGPGGEQGHRARRFTHGKKLHRA